MNTRSFSLIGFLFFIQLQNIAFSQSSYRIGGLPAINLNIGLKKDWSLNTKLESRQLFLTKSPMSISNKDYRYVLTDFGVVSAKKIGLNSKIGLGYLMRFENSEFYHRFLQQYVIVQRMPSWRLAHRFLSDQTFSQVESPEFRIRYRITSEIPLNGESVDPREFYLKINNEYINGFQANEYDLEMRLIPLLGYNIWDNFKIETGLDYRINSFLSSTTRQSYWMSFNAYIEI